MNVKRSGQKVVPSNALHSPCSKAVERLLCLISWQRIARHVWPSLTHLPLGVICLQRVNAGLYTSSIHVGRPALFPPSSSEREERANCPEEAHILYFSPPHALVPSEIRWRRRMNSANNTNKFSFLGLVGTRIGCSLHYDY